MSFDASTHEVSPIESVLSRGELLVGGIKDIPVGLDKPLHTSRVVLPNMDGYRIRRGMHTDSLLSFARWLKQESQQPKGINLHDLKIQGRVLTREQYDKLQERKTYSFFLSGRSSRTDEWDQDEVVKILLPKTTKLTQEDVERLIHLAYSPETDAKEVGYPVGWYDSKFLMKCAYESPEVGNSLLPVLGGVNEFMIGSDTLDDGTLKGLSLRLKKQFSDGESRINESRAVLKPEILERVFKSYKVPLFTKLKANADVKI